MFTGGLAELGVASTAGARAILKRLRSTPEDTDDVLDPRNPSHWEGVHKAFVAACGVVGLRNVASQVASNTVCHFDIREFPNVRGLVALTIDDAPCRQRCQSKNMLREMQVLLAEYSAKATFFICSDHLPGHEAGMVELLAKGHEVANHCARDRLYSRDAEEDFESALLQSERVCEDLRNKARALSDAERQQVATRCCDGCLPWRRSIAACAADHASRAHNSNTHAPVKWFRAPGGSLSIPMMKVLDRRGFTHVLCDAYANDAWISDPSFITAHVLRHATDGSIILLHMPERGFREYSLEATRGILEGLRLRNLRSVTLTELHTAAYSAVV